MWYYVDEVLEIILSFYNLLFKVYNYRNIYLYNFFMGYGKYVVV